MDQAIALSKKNGPKYRVGGLIGILNTIDIVGSSTVYVPKYPSD